MSTVPTEPEEQAPAAPGAGEVSDADVVDNGGGRTFAETVRKAVLTGLGAVFLTEEGARRRAREWKLPKEIVGFIATQATSAKDEIVRVVSEEVRKFFESEALRREFLRAVGSMSIEVHAEVRLKPAKGGHVEPEVKVSSVKPRLRRGKRDEGEGQGGAEGA